MNLALRQQLAIFKQKWETGPIRVHARSFMKTPRRTAIVHGGSASPQWPKMQPGAVSRRAFLAGGCAAAVGATVMPAILSTTVLGAQGSVAPSNRVTIGIIGKGAMGGGHIHRLANDPAFQVLAVCDVDESRRESGTQTVNDIYAARERSGSYKGCTGYLDYREVLSRDDIDAVVIVTPDHWHTLMSIEAAKAGKDIYCEKPVSVTLREGRHLVETIRRYGRVFQTGTQYRSIPAVRKVCKFIREGRLGKISAVFTPYAPISSFLGGERVKPYLSALNLQECGKAYAPMDFALPAEPPPAGLDWDRWVGPAPWRPYNKLYHDNPSPGVVPWSFDSAFGVTSSTWFLSHAADVIQWALGYEYSGPVEIIHPNSGQFPTLTARYANGTLLHFVDHWGVVKDVYRAVPADARLTGNFGLFGKRPISPGESPPAEAQLAGNFGGLFIGERGWVTNMSGSGPLQASSELLFKDIGIVPTPEVNIGGNTHHANWLACIHTRKPPSADEEIGHRAASLGHLVNICSVTGRTLRWDPVRELFIGDDGANRMLSRALRAPWRL